MIDFLCQIDFYLIPGFPGFLVVLFNSSQIPGFLATLTVLLSEDKILWARNYLTNF